MDCLKNYISIKGLTGVAAPESGLYVNDLPGISTTLLDKIADYEQAEALGVWQSVEIRALLKFEDYLKSYAVTQKGWKEVLYQSGKPKLIKPLTYNAEAVSHGIKLTLPEGQYLTAYLKSVRFYSLDAVIQPEPEDPEAEIPADTFIHIYDLSTHALLKTVEHVRTAGLNEVPVNLPFTSDYSEQAFYIEVVSEGISLARFDSEIYNSDSCECSGTLALQPATLAAEAELTEENLTETETGYIALNFDIRCSLTGFICDNKQLFNQALLNLYGSELMAEKIYSPRTNFLTLFNYEQSVELKEEFKNSFFGNVQRALKMLDFEHVCIDCGAQQQSQSVYIGSVLP